MLKLPVVGIPAVLGQADSGRNKLLPVDGLSLCNGSGGASVCTGAGRLGKPQVRSSGRTSAPVKRDMIAKSPPVDPSAGDEPPSRSALAYRIACIY